MLTTIILMISVTRCPQDTVSFFLYHQPSFKTVRYSSTTSPLSKLVLIPQPLALFQDWPLFLNHRPSFKTGPYSSTTGPLFKTDHYSSTTGPLSKLTIIPLPQALFSKLTIIPLPQALFQDGLLSLNHRPSFKTGRYSSTTSPLSKLTIIQVVALFQAIMVVVQK